MVYGDKLPNSGAQKGNNFGIEWLAMQGSNRLKQKVYCAVYVTHNPVTSWPVSLPGRRSINIVHKW